MLYPMDRRSPVQNPLPLGTVFILLVLGLESLLFLYLEALWPGTAGDLQSRLAFEDVWFVSGSVPLGLPWLFMRLHLICVIWLWMANRGGSRFERATSAPPGWSLVAAAALLACAQWRLYVISGLPPSHLELVRVITN